MPVYQQIAMQCRRLVILLQQKLRQSEHLAVQAFGVLVVRTKIEHLIPEYGQTTRLQTDHGYAGFNRRFQMNENIAEQPVCFVKKSVVSEERAPATERRAWHYHSKSGVFEYLCRRNRHFGMEIVIKSVGPKNDLGLALITRRRAAGTIP